jgi:hypothetical protein
MGAPEAVQLARATLFGREVAYETEDALAEAGRLWPVTHALADVMAAEFPPPHALCGKTVVEVRLASHRRSDKPPDSSCSWAQARRRSRAP